MGGPIIKDKLHFFAAGEFRHRVTPFSGPTIGSTTNVGITADSAQRFSNILNGYGIAPGTFGAFNTSSDAQNVFAKLTAVTGKTGTRGAEHQLRARDHAGLDLPRARDQRRLPSHVGRVRARGAERGRDTGSGRRSWATGRTKLLAGYAVTNEPRSTASDAPAIFVTERRRRRHATHRRRRSVEPAPHAAAARRRADGQSDAHLRQAHGDRGRGGRADALHLRQLLECDGTVRLLRLDSLAAGRPQRFMRNLALEPGRGDVGLRRAPVLDCTRRTRGM